METNPAKLSLNQNVWLVSFGDLLTLILCFFISVISLSPLNPERKALAQSASEGGTRFAPIKEEEGPKALSLTIKDLTSDGAALTSEAIIKLESFIKSEAYESSRFDVETCRVEDQGLRTEQLLWLIKSQVFDSDGPEAAVRYGSNAAGCEAGVLARLVINR